MQSCIVIFMIPEFETYAERYIRSAEKKNPGRKCSSGIQHLFGYLHAGIFLLMVGLLRNSSIRFRSVCNSRFSLICFSSDWLRKVLNSSSSC